MALRPPPVALCDVAAQALAYGIGSGAIGGVEDAVEEGVGETCGVVRARSWAGKFRDPEKEVGVVARRVPSPGSRNCARPARPASSWWSTAAAAPPHGRLTLHGRRGR